MKKITILLLIIFLSFPLYINAETLKENNKTEIETSALYDYLSREKTKYEILKDLDIKAYITESVKGGDGNLDYSKFTKIILSYVVKELIAAIKLMVMLLIICVISSLINNLNSSFGEKEIGDIAFFACYGLSIIVLIKSFLLGVSITKDTINGMANIMAALMPVLLALLAGTGGFVQAAVLDPIVIAVINISTRIIVDVIVPIILMVFALQFASNISLDYKISKLTKLLNSIVMWINGIVMTIFITVITIRGITSKAFDEVTIQTAKFAVDTFVPIVGGAISDAVSTVAGYSILLKNAISSLGLIVLVGIVLFPIIKILILAFVNKFVAAIIEPICDKRLVAAINSAGDSLILLSSCIIVVSLMFFIIIAIIAGSKPMS